MMNLIRCSKLIEIIVAMSFFNFPMPFISAITLIESKGSKGVMDIVLANKHLFSFCCHAVFRSISG
jgi:hypothetical protein